MADPLSRVFYPSTFPELFSAWNHFPDAELSAGGTGFTREQETRVPAFPQSVISLDGMEELKRISRTERYLEIGAMVKLNQIINLGKIVPEALSRCLSRLADHHVRNQATIGGNICFPSRRLDACTPMIALDAQYELRTTQSTRWVSASRLSSMTGAPILERHELLTRIRVPLEPWTFTWYRKFRGADINESGGSVLFIMKNEKNILTSIRIIHAGKTIFRDKDSEAMLLGKRLPLSRKDAESFVESWTSYLSGTRDTDDMPQAELTMIRVINFVRTMLRHISD